MLLVWARVMRALGTQDGCGLGCKRRCGLGDRQVTGSGGWRVRQHKTGSTRRSAASLAGSVSSRAVAVSLTAKTMAPSSSVACIMTLARSECVVEYHRRSTRDMRASLRDTPRQLIEAGLGEAGWRFSSRTGPVGLWACADGGALSVSSAHGAL